MSPDNFPFLVRLLKCDNTTTRKERRRNDSCTLIHEIWTMLNDHCTILSHHRLTAFLAFSLLPYLINSSVIYCYNSHNVNKNMLLPVHVWFGSRVLLKHGCVKDWEFTSECSTGFKRNLKHPISAWTSCSYGKEADSLLLLLSSSKKNDHKCLSTVYV